MILTILITIVFSIIIIFGSHSLYNYLKNMYSIKRNKCAMNFQTEKYKNIINELIDQKKQQDNVYLTHSEKKTMIENLENFLYEYANSSSTKITK